MFLLGGALNTALTYLVYLALGLITSYQVAYFSAFVLGIALAYSFNSRFVFNALPSWSRATIYPAIYAVQYMVAATALRVLVEDVGISNAVAPLLVTAIVLPLTYVMNRMVLTASMASLQRINATLRHTFVAVAIAAGITVAAIWLPFGFRLGGLIEEWDVLGLFVTHGLFFVASGSSPLPMHAVRPLTILPHALSYLLDDTTFDGWHVVLIAALLAKGTAAGMLIWQASRSRAAAVAVATLILVYPADTMQLSFRGIHIAWSMAIMLAASATLVNASDAKNRRKRLTLTILACILAFASMCMYEAAIVFFPLPFAILLVRNELRVRDHSLPSFAGVALPWGATAALYVSYVVLTLRAGESYQADVALSGGTFATVEGNFPRLFSMAMPHVFLGGWIDAGSMLWNSFATHTWLIVAVILVAAAVIGLACARDSLAIGSTSRRQWIGLMYLGIAFAVFGYAPYLVSGSHMLVSQRTFLFASFGGAVWLVAILGTVHARFPIVAAAGYVALFTLGLASQWVQFHHYVSLSDLQKRELGAIASNFDGNPSSRTIIIADASDYLGQDWMFPRETLPLTLAYVYGHAVGNVEVCHMSTGEWFRSDDGGRHGSCGKDASGWFFRPPLPLPHTSNPSTPFHLDSASIVEVSIARDTPEKNPDTSHFDPVVQSRVGRMLSISPPSSMDLMFRDAIDLNAYHWTFGKWWSMDEPIRGTGWRAPEWDIKLKDSRAYAWKTAPLATLDFVLQPSNGAYVLSGQTGQFALNVAPSMVAVTINGQSIPLSWKENNSFTGLISPGLLRTGVNQIAFNAPTNTDYYGLSFQLSAINIRPAR